MNLQPITHQRDGQELICVVCLKRGKVSEMLADLDGPSFLSFVHADTLLRGCRTIYETKVREAEAEAEETR